FSDMIGQNKGDTITEIPFSDTGNNTTGQTPVESNQSKKTVPLVSASKKEVKQGQVIHEKGSKFSTDSPVTLFFDLPNGKTVSLKLNSDSSGKFDYRYVMPEDAMLGGYWYYARDEETGVYSEKISFKVIEGNKKTSSSSSSGNVSASLNNKPVDDKESEKSSKKLSEGGGEPLVSICSYSASSWSSSRPVIINEIAWMGSTVSSSDEWIELKNISPSAIDISGYELIGEGGDIKIKFPDGSIIPAGGFYLLERTDDGSAPNVTADLIYSGAISNTDDGLKLLDKGCFIVDRVIASPEWDAGDASSRRTMERVGSGWQTSENPNGTPKMANSSGYLVSNSTTNQSTSTNTNVGGGTTIPACSTRESNPFLSVRFNEVAWSGDSTSAYREWIELYNPSQSEISLSGWQIEDKARDIKITFGSGHIIPADGYFLIERGEVDFITGIQADAFFSGAINNSDEELYIFDNSCVLIDRIRNTGENWENLGGSASPEYQTAERDEVGWHTYSGNIINGINGTPKTLNSPPSEDQGGEEDNEQDEENDENEILPFVENDIDISYDPLIVSIIFSYPDVSSEWKVKVTDKDTSEEIESPYRIYSVNRNYNLEFEIFNNEDELIDSITKTIFTDPFAAVAFRSGTRKEFDLQTKSGTFIELDFGAYPFLPQDLMLSSVYGHAPNFKTVVLYLNREAPKEEFLNYEIPSESISGVMEISYKSVDSYGSRRSLLLPDAENVTLDASINGKSLSYFYFLKEGDGNMVFLVTGPSGESGFSSSDYFTVGYYGFVRAGDKDQFKLIAVDDKKYRLSGQFSSLSPNQPFNISFTPSESNSDYVRIAYEMSDPDSPDIMLSSEISINGGEWTNHQPGQSVLFPAGEQTMSVRLRVTDDFGVVSRISTAAYTRPLE
ncbi:MAG: lamin tail domain-containing protein, partial [Candidatus Colwellbacteria bacterium]|nr:lamin tail domain-containing protein [Candidatus Colwellbacteria bacterium]